MKTINKKYTIYKFHELSKEIQDRLINFNVQATCRNQMMSTGKMPNIKFIKALIPYEKKELKKCVFFKNGDYAIIPEGE